MNEIIQTIGLRKDDILQGIDFTMLRGEMIAIMGPSGSGKSTFLYQLSGMDRPNEGAIYFDGKEITKQTEDENAYMRLTKMGFVFQQMNMLSNLNVIDNIILPAVQCNKMDKNKTEEEVLRQKAKTWMEKTGIDGLGQRKITEVSGGQLQRACICRALVNDPKLVFADEPTGALNQSASAEVMKEFVKLNQTGMSILVVTHDSKVASICDRVIYMIDGKLAGEYKLGKYKENNAKNRELQLTKWLDEMNW